MRIRGEPSGHSCWVLTDPNVIWLPGASYVRIFAYSAPIASSTRNCCQIAIPAAVEICINGGVLRLKKPKGFKADSSTRIRDGIKGPMREGARPSPPTRHKHPHLISQPVPQRAHLRIIPTTDPIKKIMPALGLEAELRKRRDQKSRRDIVRHDHATPKRDTFATNRRLDSEAPVTVGRTTIATNAVHVGQCKPLLPVGQHAVLV